MSWVCHIRLGTSSAQPKEPRVPLAPHDSLVNPPLCVPSISMRDAEILSPACWGEAASGFFSSTGSAAWVGLSTSISTRIHAQRSATPITFQDFLAGIWDQKQHSYALITATNGLCGFWSIGILDRSIIEHLLTQRTFAFIGGCVLCRFPLASSLGFTIVTERMRAVWQNCAHKLRPRQGHLALLLLLPRGACRVNVTAKATI